MDYGLPGFSVHEIFQARILEWVAMPSSRGISQPGIEPISPALAGEFFTTEPPGKLYIYIYEIILLYTLNILQFCQLYLSKTGKKWPCYLKSGWLKTHFTHIPHSLCIPVHFNFIYIYIFFFFTKYVLGFCLTLKKQHSVDRYLLITYILWGSVLSPEDTTWSLFTHENGILVSETHSKTIYTMISATGEWQEGKESRRKK